MRYENLRYPTSTEEARAWGRNGGIASGKARKRKRAMREAAEAILNCTANEDLQRQMAAQGFDGKNYLDAVTFSLIGQALQGNTRAIGLVMELLGAGARNEIAQRELEIKEEQLAILKGEGAQTNEVLAALLEEARKRNGDIRDEAE